MKMDVRRESMIAELTLHRLDASGIRKIRDQVALDEGLELHINGIRYRRLTASPTMRRELVYGHLYTHGIAHPGDIEEIIIKPPKVYVRLRREIDVADIQDLEAQLLSEAEGIKPVERLRELRVDVDIKVEAERLMRLMEEMERRGVTFRKTGGVHGALLASPQGEIAAYVEDVSRHSAVDKAVGSMLLRNLRPWSFMLFSTGRQSASMVLKAARCGIPLIASRAAPISSGVKVAEVTGITLICFLREGRMNIYTHPERVLTRG